MASVDYTYEFVLLFFSAQIKLSPIRRMQMKTTTHTHTHRRLRMGIEIHLFVKEICRWREWWGWMVRFRVLSAVTTMKTQTKQQQQKWKQNKKWKIKYIFRRCVALNFQATQSESASLQIVAKNQQRNLINELMI